MKKFKSPTIHDKPMWDIWMSIYHLPIMTVADELGFFTHLNINNGLNIEQLANKLKITHRSVEILAEPLNSLGFIRKRNKIYYLTHTSKTYLLPESPYYWGAILENQRDRNEYKKILDAIKTGSNQLLHGNKTFTDMWKEGSITPEAATHFTKKMHATIFAPATMAVESGVFNSTKMLLDAGGGSGCFSIAYLKKYPERKATVFELPVVCDVAKQYISQYELTNKIMTHVGDFFNRKTWPTGHDGVLLSQILHDWPEKYCKKILKNAYDTLPTRGKIYIHEMLLDSKKSPLTVACFDLLMFINHKSQQFTKNQLFDLLKFTGFKNYKMKKTFGHYSIISATK